VKDTILKKIVAKMIPVKIRKQLINFNILSSKYGQYNTINNWDCADANGDKIPWYTYPSIEYLDNIDFTEKSVLEYGSGNSTIYWGNKAKHVISIENDKDWYLKVKVNLKANQTLLYKEDSCEYEKAIELTGNKFDVIVIDGIRRVECTRVIKQYLNINSPEGFIVIFDNSDWYKGAAKYLRNDLDLIEVDFHGFGPINAYTWTTSIFVSRNYNFKSINNIQPNYSKSAIRNCAE
jgi:hypothetical protein